MAQVARCLRHTSDQSCTNDAVNGDQRTWGERLTRRGANDPGQTSDEEGRREARLGAVAPRREVSRGRCGR
jgi:hypothetical protein